MVQKRHAVDILISDGTARGITIQLSFECLLGQPKVAQLHLDPGDECFGQSFLLLSREPVHGLAGAYLIQIDVKSQADYSLLSPFFFLLYHTMGTNQVLDLSEALQRQFEEPYPVLP